MHRGYSRQNQQKYLPSWNIDPTSSSFLVCVCGGGFVVCFCFLLLQTKNSHEMSRTLENVILFVRFIHTHTCTCAHTYTYINLRWFTYGAKNTVVSKLNSMRIFLLDYISWLMTSSTEIKFCSLQMKAEQQVHAFKYNISIHKHISSWGIIGNI